MKIRALVHTSPKDQSSRSATRRSLEKSFGQSRLRFNTHPADHHWHRPTYPSVLQSARGGVWVASSATILLPNVRDLYATVDDDVNLLAAPRRLNRRRRQLSHASASRTAVHSRVRCVSFRSMKLYGTRLWLRLAVCGSAECALVVGCVWVDARIGRPAKPCPHVIGVSFACCSPHHQSSCS